MQSGYSVGAMILGTIALLERTPDPTEADIRDMLSGILDRETGYVKPVEAVLRAAAVAIFSRFRGATGFRWIIVRRRPRRNLG